MPTEPLKYFREHSSKFDYFWLGAILTILGFSIHTYDPTDQTLHVWAIKTTWILLIISFISGFWRQEKLIHGYRAEAIIHEWNPPEQTELEKQQKDASFWAVWSYRVKKLTFYLGFGLLVFFKWVNS